MLGPNDSLVLAYCLIGVLCFTTANAFHKELSLTSHQGDTAFLPCSYPTTERTAVWKIQDRIYSTYKLPSGIFPLSNGLFINNVSLESEGIYICMIYNGSSLETLYTTQLTVDVSLEPEKDKVTNEFDFGSPDSSNLQLRGTKGDVLYLPCAPALGTRNVSVWAIDGRIYPLTRLPPYHVQHYGGIILFNASINIVGHIYECFSVIENKLQQLYTVDLRITNLNLRETDSGPSVVAVHQNLHTCFIYMISRKVAFDVTTKVFAFMEDYTCTPMVTTVFNAKVQNTSSGNILWTNNSTDTQPTFFIPSMVFGSNEYGSVEGSDGKNVTSMTYNIQVAKNELTANHCVFENETACLNLPLEFKSVNAVWQRRPGSDEDCECPLFIGEQARFSDCYCFTDDVQPTTYDVKLLNNTLCWINLSHVTNDTKVLLIKYDEYETSNLLIYNQTRIIVEDPITSTPNVTYISANNSLCADSKNTEWSPIIGTIVTVYDITGDAIRDRVEPHSRFCLLLHPFPKSCTPFKFDVTSLSECTESSPSIEYGSGNGNECECLQAKVNLTLNASEVTSHSAVVTLQILCINKSVGYDVTRISNLYLRVFSTDSSTGHITTAPFMVPCYQKYKSILLANLTSSTSYNVSVQWKSQNVSNFRKCDVVDNQFGFKTADDPDMYNSQTMLIALVVVSLIIVCVGGAACVGGAICCWRKFKNQAYSVNDSPSPPESEKQPLKTKPDKAV